MKKNLSGKRILLISNMYPSRKFPHYGVFVQNTEKILQEHGWRVDCAAIHKQTGKFGKLWAYGLFHIKVLTCVLTGRYDCIYAHYISHTAFALLLAKKLKPNLKIVVNVHGNDIVPEDEHDKKYLPLVYKIRNQVECWIVPSSYFGDILQKEYGVPERKVVVYPSGGVDCKKFKETDHKACRQKLNIRQSDFVAGFVGRIEKNKGWDTFVEAVAEVKAAIPDVKCLMVGSGEQDADLERLIQEKDVENVILRFPLVPQEELVSLYNAMDVFCLPSYRKSESLALAGLEAMACGCIVAASNMAGPATYVRDGENGFLFEPQNARELSEKLLAVYGMSSEEKKHIREKALKTALKYDREAVKEILLKVFSEI